MEEFIEHHSEISYIYHKLLNDKYLNSLFSKEIELQVMSIIFIIYYVHLEKKELREEIVIYMCYYLINYFGNITYPIYLCSKIKYIVQWL